MLLLLVAFLLLFSAGDWTESLTHDAGQTLYHLATTQPSTSWFLDGMSWSLPLQTGHEGKCALQFLTIFSFHWLSMRQTSLGEDVTCDNRHNLGWRAGKNNSGILTPSLMIKVTHGKTLAEKHSQSISALWGKLQRSLRSYLSKYSQTKLP